MVLGLCGRGWGWGYERSRPALGMQATKSGARVLYPALKSKGAGPPPQLNAIRKVEPQRRDRPLIKLFCSAVGLGSGVGSSPRPFAPGSPSTARSLLPFGPSTTRWLRCTAWITRSTALTSHEPVFTLLWESLTTAASDSNLPGLSVGATTVPPEVRRRAIAFLALRRGLVRARARLGRGQVGRRERPPALVQPIQSSTFGFSRLCSSIRVACGSSARFRAYVHPRERRLGPACDEDPPRGPVPSPAGPLGELRTSQQHTKPAARKGRRGPPGLGLGPSCTPVSTSPGPGPCRSPAHTRDLTGAWHPRH